VKDQIAKLLLKRLNFLAYCTLSKKKILRGTGKTEIARCGIKVA
jgi:hypothetical protein